MRGVPHFSWVHKLVALVVFVGAQIIPVSIANAQPQSVIRITGDDKAWDDVFASRTPQVLLDGPANDLVYTEGPLVLTKHALLFSDTIQARIHLLNVSGVLEHNDVDKAHPSRHLHTIKERSGDAPHADDHWRAEPGSNGLAFLPKSNDDGHDKIIIVCQHGARRLATLKFPGGSESLPVATEYGGKRLNGPNDLAVQVETSNEGQETIYVYFTDPVYAWLEKSRFSDQPYLDEQVQKNGPGMKGVYRVELDQEGYAKGNVELVLSDMARPNGIAFDGDKNLIVSDCCQGDHLDDCASGTSRWEILQRHRLPGVAPEEEEVWVRSATIEDTVDTNTEQATGGCADGFAVHTFSDDDDSGKEKRVLVASCFGGMCIVDMELQKIVARMWTGDCVISNAALDEEHVYFTGSCGIWMLPLRAHNYGVNEEL